MTARRNPPRVDARLDEDGRPLIRLRFANGMETPWLPREVITHIIDKVQTDIQDSTDDEFWKITELNFPDETTERPLND